jgi:cytidyltransferase-like protein
MTKVMIFGTFDGLHEGHKFLVEQAKKLGDSVVAVVGTSPNVEKIKGRPPFASGEKRMQLMREMFPDIRVIEGSSQDFLAPLRAEKPDLILFGYDQKLPPGISFDDLQCPYKRAEALKPHIYKSSLLPRPEGGDIEKKSKK